MGFTDEDANFEPDPTPTRWRLLAASLLLGGTAAFGGCVYAMQRAVDALSGFELGIGDFDFEIGWDEVDETPVSTVPPQPAATCAALAKVAFTTEVAGSVWRVDTQRVSEVVGDERLIRALVSEQADRLRSALPPLRDALWDAIAASPRPVADHLAIALAKVNEQLILFERPGDLGDPLLAFEGGQAIDDASDALGSGCGDLDLIGPFDSYLVVDTAPTTTTTTALASS